MKSTYQPRQPGWGHRAILVLILVTCFRVWSGPIAWIEQAQAQILPNPALQRRLQLDELRRTNTLLAEIKELLATHTLNVRLKGADNHAPALQKAQPGRG